MGDPKWMRAPENYVRCFSWQILTRFVTVRSRARERTKKNWVSSCMDFFQFWGHGDYRGGDEGNGQTVLVYDGTQERNDLDVLVMRCPLTGKNVNPFTASVWRAIHAEF